MSNIDTISEFLIHAGTDYRVFDMARGITAVDSQNFLEIENGSVPAPHPRQQHAWFGILFFNKNASTEQYIWFVKLPVDEQGLVISAGRRQFLQIVVEALGQQLDNKQNPNNQLPENPFTFIPNQNQLADFNALCRQSLALGTSQHFEKMQSYVSHPEKHDWQQIPIQGIADYCAQLSIDDHKTVFLKNFERLSIEIQTAICTSLENHTISPDISNVLINWYQLDKANPQRLHSVLRALGQASDKTKVEHFIQVLLQDEKPADQNTLMLIAARHWHFINNPKFAKNFMESLAESEEALFIGLYSDLVQIPNIRESMLAVLRWPDKSPKLLKAIGALFGQS